ncbi:hypothetical protein C2E23DRAFT_882918 [Lenzites betulinus]|nr:hypothetical protein C2E23DRAFT_882918 [Lenzites betulinus]
MSQISWQFRDRLQQILAEVVNRDDVSIPYRDLAYLMRPRKLRSSQHRDSPYRAAIRAALHGLNPTSRCPSYTYPAPKKHTQSRDTAVTDYLEAATLVKAIQKVIGAHGPFGVDIPDVPQLPQTIRSMLESEQALRAENCDFVLQLTDLNNEVDELHARVGKGSSSAVQLE